MSTLSIVIRQDNAAFQPDPTPETVRLLRDIANRMEQSRHPGMSVMDANGNNVGSCSTFESPERDAEEYRDTVRTLLRTAVDVDVMRIPGEGIVARFAGAVWVQVWINVPAI